MRFARCEACGAKALLAASQCPRCTHPLALRDSLGRQVALAHCRTCDTYYRRSLGACRWCGAKAAPIGARKVAGVAFGAALIAMVVWGAVRARAGRETAAERVVAAGALSGSPLAAPADSAMAAPAVSDSAMAADAQTLGAGSGGQKTDSVSSATSSAGPGAASSPGAAVPPAATSPPAALAPAAVTGWRDSSARWTPAVARTWANVRTDARAGARVVGIVTPNMRVQLGTLRAGWRRLRAPGIDGWADARYFDSLTAVRR